MTICPPSCPAKKCDNLSHFASRDEYFVSRRLDQSCRGATQCDNLSPFVFPQVM